MQSGGGHHCGGTGVYGIFLAAGGGGTGHCAGGGLVRQGQNCQPDGVHRDGAFDVLHYPDHWHGAAHHAGQPDLNVDYGGAGGVQRIGVSGEKLETGESQAVTKSKKRRHGSLIPCQKLQKKPNMIFW